MRLGRTPSFRSQSTGGHAGSHGETPRITSSPHATAINLGVNSRFPTANRSDRKQMHRQLVRSSGALQQRAFMNASGARGTNR
jgi:hypothetical protein